MTPNHEYNTPEHGQQDWHIPLNENFEQLDIDVEIRDIDANRTEYEPEDGAKYLAIDTGIIYIGDGDSWQTRHVLARGEGFSNVAPGTFSLVHGGLDNRAPGEYATVVGGKSNVASGRGAIAAGVRARAQHDGSIVLGDHTSTVISSKRSGEVRSQMPVYAPSFNTTSARAAKTGIEPVDPQAVLEGVTSMSITTWSLTDGDRSTHMGPMAGMFTETFDLGDGESIASVDADGVAFAAIQALASELEAATDRIQSLEAATDELRERITEIESDTTDTHAE